MHRGDVLRVDLGQPAGGSGHEQAGTRPVVVVSLGNDDPGNPLITVVPSTGRLSKANYPHTLTVDPTTQNGLTTQSVLMAFQVVSIDKRRVLNVIGRLEDATLARLSQLLRELIGL